MFSVICFVSFRPTHAVIHTATSVANKRIFRLFSGCIFRQKQYFNSEICHRIPEIATLSDQMDLNASFKNKWSVPQRNEFCLVGLDSVFRFVTFIMS